MFIERCIERNFTDSKEFWAQCGLLLARIHAAFWDKVDALPEFFHVNIDKERLGKAIYELMDFMESLTSEDIATLEKDLGLSLTGLRSSLESVDGKRLPEPGVPSPVVCRVFS